MTPYLHVCSIQPAVVWGDPERTFDHIAGLVAEAGACAPLDVVVLPEHFNAAVDEEGETKAWQLAQGFAAALAQLHRVHVVAGSVERWDALTGRRRNTAVVYDRQGNVLGKYDKQRLFGFERRRQVNPGEDTLIVRLDGVACGILICADLWYPELVRSMAGLIDVLLVPAQTTLRAESEPSYARWLWHTLAMTRAQENVIAVFVSDQAATSQAPFRCGGVACATDPSAEPDVAAMQRALADGGPGTVAARIDLARLWRFRDYRRENGLLPPAGEG